MISIIQNGPVYEIRFPYDQDVISIVKSVAGRRWSSEEKTWIIPKDKVGFFLNLLKGTKYEKQVHLQSNEDVNVNAKFEDTPSSRIPNIDISSVKTYVKQGSKLFNHQQDCLRYSIARKKAGNFNGFLLADEMGCLSGSCVVDVEINGRRKSMPLQTLYKKFSEKDEQDVFLIRSYQHSAGNDFRYLPIRCVLSKGPMLSVKVTFYDGTYVICTPDHEILTNAGWKSAEKLKPSDLVVKSYTDSLDRFKAVSSVSSYGVVEVYDVGILHPFTHNFVCNDVVVHNCGKTLEVINLALLKKQCEHAKHCLIICCVNAAKYNWVDDIATHTNGEFEGYVLGSRIKRDGSVNFNGTGKQKLQDLETGLMYSSKKINKPIPYFLILNVEALRTSDKKAKRSLKDVLTLKLADMCLNGDVSFIALDEIHRNASPQSAQGKEILKLKTLTGNKVEWIPMTGTPIVNKPTDAFLPLRLINAHTCNSYYMWNKRYCIYGGYGNHNIVAYKNILELKAILEPNMLRRTKDKVLGLPKKIHHVEYVENSKIQQQLYDEERAKLSNAWYEGNSDEKKKQNPLTMFLTLRQITSCPEVVDDSINAKDASYLSVNAKMKRLVELIQDITAAGEKAVVFSNFVAPLRSAYRCLKRKGIDVAAYIGTMSEEEREQSKSKFVRNPSCKVILGTVGALGTSHTLSVASNVVFIDEPWNAAALDQAEDRCYRLDSKKPVNVYSIVAKDTVDEKVHKIIRTKRGTSSYIVDNELNFRESPELVRMLLS